MANHFAHQMTFDSSINDIYQSINKKDYEQAIEELEDLECNVVALRRAIEKQKMLDEIDELMNSKKK